MAYEKTVWKDHVVERPKTYRMVENADGTVTLVPETGQVIQQGTALNAENLNHIEDTLAEHDETLGKRLPTSGGTMTGNIDLGGNALTNVKAPAAATDAATKGYVDERIVTHQNVSVPASAWGSGAEFAGATRTRYADIALAGVTSDIYATVTFNQNDIDNYNLAGICATKDGKITIYAEYAPSVDITIPTIICLKA